MIFIILENIEIEDHETKIFSVDAGVVCIIRKRAGSSCLF